MKIQWLLLAAIFLRLFAISAYATTYYVDINNTNPTPPYTSWSTASTNIQSAVNLTTNGDLVLINPGIYESGGIAAPDGILTSIEVTNAVTLEGVDGPTVTSINGRNAVRCVYLNSNASLIGLTLTGGLANNGSGIITGQVVNNGGGLYCASTNDVVSNCQISGNSAVWEGGGVYGGILTNCTISGNSVTVNGGAGGGAIFSSLTNCTISGNSVAEGRGGGVFICTLNNCTVSGNSAQIGGGGACNSTLNNCQIFGNEAADGGGTYLNTTANNCIYSNNSASFGGAAYQSSLNNCLLINNSSYEAGGADDSDLYNCTVVGNTDVDVVGGVRASELYNSIVYFNNSVEGIPNYDSYTTFSYSCTTPLPTGAGNISNDPLLVNLAGGDCHLQPNSPCIDVGNNAYVQTISDLDGYPRILGGTVDIGCYEYQTPAPVWLQQYGLPTDGSVNYEDLDGTGFTVNQDWAAGLNPTNPASVLVMLSPSPTNTTSGITVTWQSVSGIQYNLLRSTNLSAPSSFIILTADITGDSGTTSYTDTSATNNTPYFYRVGVP